MSVANKLAKLVSDGRGFALIIGMIAGLLLGFPLYRAVPGENVETRELATTNPPVIIPAKPPTPPEPTITPYEQAARVLEAKDILKTDGQRWVLGQLRKSLPVTIKTMGEIRIVADWCCRLPPEAQDAYALKCLEWADGLWAGTILPWQMRQSMGLRKTTRYGNIRMIEHFYEIAYNVAHSLKLRNRASLSFQGFQQDENLKTWRGSDDPNPAGPEDAREPRDWWGTERK